MSIRVVILAAGKGSRLGGELPKALIPIDGKPILQHLFESVVQSGIDSKPVVIVGHERTRICDAFGGRCAYVVQEEQLGTGHAVKIAQQAVGDADALIVLYGDHPFISAQTLCNLAAKHEVSNSVMTVMTTTVPSFFDWYHAFEHWGRILRNTNGNIVGNRQYKDASDQERMILEVDSALYCFDTHWLWETIHRIENRNAQGEYYLTDLFAMAVAQGHTIASLSLPPEEAIGINTQEELEIAERLCRNSS